jgi:hypothetical protein
MKRAGASSQTPAAATHFASAFLPTTSPSPSSSSSSRPTGPHRQGSALDFSHAAVEDDADDDAPHPNHVDRLDSLPLFNTRAMNTAAAQAAAVADSSSSFHGGGLDGAAPRRRGVAGSQAAKDGAFGSGFDTAGGLDLDGGLDGDEKRGLTGNGRAPARREKPAYKPPAKTWVRARLCPDLGRPLGRSRGGDHRTPRRGLRQARLTTLPRDLLDLHQARVGGQQRRPPDPGSIHGRFDADALLQDRLEQLGRLGRGAPRLALPACAPQQCLTSR